MIEKIIVLIEIFKSIFVLLYISNCEDKVNNILKLGHDYSLDLFVWLFILLLYIMIKYLPAVMSEDKHNKAQDLY